ncbi:MAG TPA: phytoene/squalene synthase family protein [Patescibacteria group bacterium]|jgi:farnesyl-diphosphate farnesyltransferase|nr:phytoene/squalene synthase family protein [Patescibacteria group bacterium]
MMEYGGKQILTALLRDVSRSFYLTLRVLPSTIRPQISLAYLLARTTDTIADTELVPLGQRLTALESFRESVLGKTSTPLRLGEFVRQQGTPAERALLEKVQDAIGLLASLAPADRNMVVAVLRTIVSGQELDLRRFADASVSNILALQTAEELDDYTYRVAGCVGEFWTRMCRTHVFPRARLDDELLLANGIRFGKGLQLVNILRDLPKDVRNGRCYLPQGQLQAAGITPKELLIPATEALLRPTYNAWLEQAQSHLAAGWAYTKSLPARCIRVRLACAWPLLLGARTLALLRNEAVLDPERRIKVSRSELKGLLWRSVLYYPWPRKWERLYQQTCTHY